MEIQNQWLSTAQSMLSVAFWLLTSFLYHSARIIYKFLYVITVPLMYPLYYVFAAVAFLLSPLWIVLKVLSSVAMWTAGLVVKLKYLYIYFAIAGIIGIMAACMMHGTSSMLFVILGIAPSGGKQQPQPIRHQSQRALLQRLHPQEVDAPMGEGSDDEDDEEQSRASSSLRLSGSSSSGLLPRGSLSEERLLVTDDMLEEQWRRARSTKMSPIKPSQRFRGLLAQTIHEESSESESM